MEWDANIPISEIELSKSEQKMLVALEQSCIYAERKNIEEAYRLRHFGLASMQATPAKEGVPKVSNIGLAQLVCITDKGKDYLAYIRKRKSRTRADHIHDWLIALVSALAGALLSEPLWEILHNIHTMLSK